MYAYIRGMIVDQTAKSIILDNNGIGYEIMVSNPYSYELEKEVKVYLYQHVREDELTLYGFKSSDEKSVFLKLISVKGVGAKMALPILATGTLDGIIDAIERENVLYLKKFPKIGDKVARQIILDLKGKFDFEISGTTRVEDYSELTEVLKGLGYKQNNINKVIPNITSEKIEDQVKEALKFMLK